MTEKIGERLIRQAAERSYEQYISMADLKRNSTDQWPSWNDLTYNNQVAWVEQTKRVAEETKPRVSLSKREKQMVAHANDYAENYADAGVKGDASFLLLAKLAKALGI